MVRFVGYLILGFVGALAVIAFGPVLLAVAGVAVLIAVASRRSQ